LIISFVHCNQVRSYLNHRVKVHDMMQTITARQRLNKAVRYHREIFRMTHCSSDLVMLYQKKSEKLEFRWRDSFSIQSYDDFHDISFIFVQLNDRKIRDFFHDDHLKIFTSRTEYFMNSISTQDLSQHQTIKKTRMSKK
jgi:hypothetical protein